MPCATDEMDRNKESRMVINLIHKYPSNVYYLFMDLY